MQTTFSGVKDAIFSHFFPLQIDGFGGKTQSFRNYFRTNTAKYDIL